MNFRDFFSDVRNLAIFIELLSAVFSIVYYYKYKKVPILKFFPIILWYVFLNELLGFYIRIYISDHNAIIYNVYYGIFFTYLFILFRKYLKRKKFKSVVTAFLIVYFFTFFIEGFFKNYLIEFQTIAYVLAAVQLIIIIILYFIEILESDKVLVVGKNLLFWISVGLLLFYVGYVPYRIIRNFYTELTHSSLLIAVNVTLTVIMNVCYIIGFIWSDRKQLY